MARVAGSWVKACPCERSSAASPRCTADNNAFENSSPDWTMSAGRRAVPRGAGRKRIVVVVPRSSTPTTHIDAALIATHKVDPRTRDARHPRHALLRRRHNRWASVVTRGNSVAFFECQGFSDLIRRHLAQSVEVDDPDREFLALHRAHNAQDGHDECCNPESCLGDCESGHMALHARAVRPLMVAKSPGARRALRSAALGQQY